MSGTFAWTLTPTDIMSGWTECEAIWGKCRAEVVKALSFSFKMSCATKAIFARAEGNKFWGRPNKFSCSITQNASATCFEISKSWRTTLLLCKLEPENKADSRKCDLPLKWNGHRGSSRCWIQLFKKKFCSYLTVIEARIVMLQAA